MPKILFAEDEAALGKLVKEALGREPGFTIEWKMDGLDALNTFKAQHPDMCILDIMMPAMDGFTLARQIRAINEKVPILFLSARTKTEDAIKGFEIGGNDYVRKPFSVDELLMRIKELLKRQTIDLENAHALEEVIQLAGYSYSPQAQILRYKETNF